MFPHVPDGPAPPAPSAAGPVLPASALTLPQVAPPAWANGATPVSARAAAPAGGPATGTRAPDAVLADLLAGNARFVAGTPRFGHSVTAAVAAADRLPSAAVVACMDARVPVEALFDQDVGTLVAIRSAAHVLDRAALASVEFAVGTLGVRAIVVLGHTRCAAISAAVTAARTGTVPSGNRGYVVEDVWAAVADAGDDQDLVTRRHSERVADRLRTWLGDGAVRVVAARYDVTTGRVTLA
jgi:carbonic anhydrase